MTARELWERNRSSPAFTPPFTVYDHDGRWADIKDAKGRIVVGNISTQWAKDWVREDEERLDRYENALRKIESWSRAYPIKIFPEPDLQKAHALLMAGGITLDAVSASAMRHVVAEVGKIAREALEDK